MTRKHTNKSLSSSTETNVGAALTDFFVIWHGAVEVTSRDPETNLEYHIGASPFHAAKLATPPPPYTERRGGKCEERCLEGSRKNVSPAHTRKGSHHTIVCVGVQRPW